MWAASCGCASAWMATAATFPYRIAENAVICTLTLTSKADLKASDMCLVDLDGKQLAGSAARTSEILLHLEIYKACRKQNRAHCHPAHATAYAITGACPLRA